MSLSSIPTTWDAILQSWPLLVTLLLVALVSFLLGNRVLLSVMRRRLERLEDIEHFDAVPTKTPYRDPQSQARAEARKSIRTRYSVIRSILALGLAAGLCVAVTLPMMNTIPQALLSFLVALALGVVGVAARPIVENLIAGAVLSFSNQLRIGDTVLLDGEHYGTVEDIHATHTVVKLWDWRRYVVPNSTMLSKEIVHLTHKDDYLWAHVEFHVSSRADLKVVQEIAVRAAGRSDYFAGFEPPQFWVRDFTPQSSVCWVAAWANSPENAWYLRADIRRGLADGFREQGIDTQLHAVVIKEVPTSSAFSGLAPSPRGRSEQNAV